MDRSFVAYYRVSTDKQGVSGLGLEAQTHAVESFVARSGGEILAAFSEVESSKTAKREKLEQALALCRTQKAVLVIAKLDRLARNTAFVANLLESGVEFIACDLPEANKLTLHIMAAIAEHEREMISKRTKEALAMAKNRGQKLGNPRPDIAAMNRSWSQKAKAQREAVLPLIQNFYEQGESLSSIANTLNERGIKTCNGRSWYASSVKNVLRDVMKK